MGIAPDAKRALDEQGFAILPEFRPSESSLDALSTLGSLVYLPNYPVVQQLTPRTHQQAAANTYSGIFGLRAFPLHTDLAHWYLPPRFMVLRCVVGSPDTATLLFDSMQVLTHVDETALFRALVRPRRPHHGQRPLLRLLSRTPFGPLFRWDSLFNVPATPLSWSTCRDVEWFIGSVAPIQVTLASPGDTLLIDNWRQLHGRGEAPPDTSRHIDRAYLGAIS
jgi:alpha-ketoglutarate-dependent taurine dioxygenase